MKNLLTALVASSLLAGGAIARADPFTLSVDQQFQVFTGLSHLDGYVKVVRIGDKDKEVTVPYAFDARTRLAVARDLAELNSSIEVARAAIKSASVGMTDDKRTAEAVKIGAEAQSIDLTPVDLDALVAGDNPVPPSTLALLVPIAVRPKR